MYRDLVSSSRRPGQRPREAKIYHARWLYRPRSRSRVITFIEIPGVAGGAQEIRSTGEKAQ
jgi:hypothetical protein